MSKRTTRKPKATPGAPRQKAREFTVAPPATETVFAGIPQEEIARRAYALYQERGGEHGHDLADWLRAEAELRSQSGNGGRRQP